VKVNWEENQEGDQVENQERKWVGNREEEN
jgi:hypothetical protein